MPVLRSFPPRKAISVIPGITYHRSPIGSYPRHPLTIVVGFPRGGPVYALACLMARFISRQLGQRVIVQNRPGAAGNLAAEAAAQAAPTGYTLYICSRANMMNRWLYQVLDVDLMRDFVPVGLMATAPNILVVNRFSPICSVPELIDVARKFPGKLTCGSSGPGSSSHLLCELFKAATQTDILNIPYQGAGPALHDLTAGRLDAKFESLPSSSLRIRGGTLKPLAIAARKRMAILPDTSTMGEAGVPGFFLDNWYGLMVPAGTSSEIAMRLNEALNCALAEDDLQRELRYLGYSVPSRPNGPGLLLDLIASESVKWQAIARMHGKSGTAPQRVT